MFVTATAGGFTAWILLALRVLFLLLLAAVLALVCSALLLELLVAAELEAAVVDVVVFLLLDLGLTKDEELELTIVLLLQYCTFVIGCCCWLLVP